MEHFLVKPNYTTLSKYLTLPCSAEEMETNCPDGYAIALDAYFDNTNTLKFSGEHITEVEQGFKSILDTYGIAEHYDNLLFLALTKRVEIDTVKFHYEDTLPYKKRSKELAQLLLAFKESDEKHFTNLVLRTFTKTVKVTEPALMTWICSLIESSIAAGKVPYSVLGLEDMQMNNEAELRVKADQRIMSPSTAYTKYLADFCLSMYSYLVNETILKPNSGTLISDSMANLYFDVLVLFEMIYPNQIDSEPKDYIGAILRNQIKRLNPDRSRQ